MEKYQLTVGAFEAALTTTSSWLVVYVPKAILVYCERRLQSQIDGIRRGMETASPDEQILMAQKLMKLQGAQRRVNQRIGREKKNR